MEEIINITKGLKSLTDKEKEQIRSVKKELGKSWCHRCGYCQPCPEGIPISLILTTRSVVKRFNYNKAASLLKKATENARNCNDCRECVEKCPYDLDIPELLKENIEFWDRLKEKIEFQA